MATVNIFTLSLPKSVNLSDRPIAHSLTVVLCFMMGSMIDIKSRYLGKVLDVYTDIRKICAVIVWPIEDNESSNARKCRERSFSSNILCSTTTVEREARQFST